MLNIAYERYLIMAAHIIIISSGILLFGLPVPFIATTLILSLALRGSIMCSRVYIIPLFLLLLASTCSLIAGLLKDHSSLAINSDIALFPRLFILWLSIYLSFVANKLSFIWRPHEISTILFNSFGVLAGLQLLAGLANPHMKLFEIATSLQGSLFVGTSAMSVLISASAVYKVVSISSKFSAIQSNRSSKINLLYIPAVAWTVLFQSRLSALFLLILIALDLVAAANDWKKVKYMPLLLALLLSLLALPVLSRYTDVASQNADSLINSIIFALDDSSDQDRKNALLIPFQCNFSLLGNGTFSSRYTATICSDLDTSSWSHSNPRFTVSNLPAVIYEQGLIFSTLLVCYSIVSWMQYLRTCDLSPLTSQIVLLLNSCILILLASTSSSYYLYPMYMIAFPCSMTLSPKSLNFYR